MKITDLKKGKLYESDTGEIVECLDRGEGRFPRVPMFRGVYPLSGRERLIAPRSIKRELSERETAAFTKPAA